MGERLRNLANAAEAGDAEAMTELALVFARGEERQRVDLDKTVDWYEKAASAALLGGGASRLAPGATGVGAVGSGAGCRAQPKRASGGAGSRA